jgi:hypothetical protein
MPRRQCTDAANVGELECEDITGQDRFLCRSRGFSPPSATKRIFPQTEVPAAHPFKDFSSASALAIFFLHGQYKVEVGLLNAESYLHVQPRGSQSVMLAPVMVGLLGMTLAGGLRVRPSASQPGRCESVRALWLR